MDQVSIADLKVVSYLDTSHLGDRTVNLMPLWDGTHWHWWVPGPNGLIDIRPIEAMLVDYVSQDFANESDLLIPFVELMWQRASWPEICPLISSICDDFHNMGTCLAKLKHFFRTRSELRGAASGFAATELEYLVVLARGVFDLLQEIIASIWKSRVRLNDPNADRRRRAQALPEMFSRVVLRDKTEVRSVLEIENQFGLPPNLASAYFACAPFFLNLRNTRDNIVHGGSGINHVFDTERGFCVNPKTRPFRSFQRWLDTHRYNENLVSVLPWVASVVIGTIDACNSIVVQLSNCIVLPAEIAPGYHVFVRGPYNSALIEVLQIAEGRPPWWDHGAQDNIYLDESRLRCCIPDIEDRIRERAYYLWKNQSTPTWNDPDENWRHAEQIERIVSGSSG